MAVQEEEFELSVDGKSYRVTGEVFKQVQSVLANSKVEPVEINGVDAGIVSLLEELCEVDWKKVVPDLHARSLLSLAYFLSRYGVHEGASELANCSQDDFLVDPDISLDVEPHAVLKVIRNGDFWG